VFDIIFSTKSNVKLGKFKSVMIIIRMIENDFLHTEQSSKIESFLSVKLAKFNPNFSIIGIFFQVRIELFYVLINSSLFLFFKKDIYFWGSQYSFSWIEITKIFLDYTLKISFESFIDSKWDECREFLKIISFTNLFAKMLKIFSDRCKGYFYFDSVKDKLFKIFIFFFRGNKYFDQRCFDYFWRVNKWYRNLHQAYHRLLFW